MGRCLPLAATRFASTAGPTHEAVHEKTPGGRKTPRGFKRRKWPMRCLPAGEASSAPRQGSAGLADRFSDSSA
jgi:hypothetical protein